jgi:hypothetical protein
MSLQSDPGYHGLENASKKKKKKIYIYIYIYISVQFMSLVCILLKASMNIMTKLVQS